jgi:hypothetical protein
VILREGRGFFLRHGLDSPWAGWVGSRFLEEGLASVHAAPARALSRLMSVSGLCSGGMALLWDHVPAWMQALHPEERVGWWEALSSLPGLQVHLRMPDATSLPGGVFRAWVHGPEAPSGSVGEAWRQGYLGWVPDSAGQWSLPGLGTLRPPKNEEAGCGWLWGEVVIPLGALQSVREDGALSRMLGDAQNAVETALAQRMAAGAWPESLPFLRRQAGWRVALTGGLEYQRANGDWTRAAEDVRQLKDHLIQALRVPSHVGASSDAWAASYLGRRAMAEGLPWRNSLPLPPQPSAFTPGLASDPRDPAPLQARGSLPSPLAALMDHPPLALLRLPAVPSEGAAAQLRKDITPGQALRLLPPELPPPGPFDPEHPWASADQFPMPMDPAAGEQIALFELG